MNRLCLFAGMMLGSYLGWFAGSALGMELFGCFLLSGLGSLAGVYAGWKFAQRYR
ncbi:MAG: hypothetical protein NDI75_06590 [Candidatus Didemnitutus sp.]|jgi:hypothetical protein|nr:hypothetical protein [Candidatus Didemnitutus sp.]